MAQRDTSGTSATVGCPAVIKASRKGHLARRHARHQMKTTYSRKAKHKDAQK